MPTLTSNKCQELFKCRVGSIRARVMGGRWERDEPGSAEFRDSETDVCFCLSGRLELVISTILKQNRRPGVLLYDARVSQQAQCKSAQLEHLPPISTGPKIHIS